MLRKLTAVTASLIAGLMIALPQSVLAESPSQRNVPPDAAGIEFFEKQIRPVLVRACYDCHSKEADSELGGLRLDSRESMLEGGDHGPTLVPGNAEASLLISALRHEELEMPPEGKLEDQTIANFVRWIRMGAPDPRTNEGPLGATGSPQDHWAFQKPTVRPVPTVEDNAWPYTAIDRFVLDRLEQSDLRPVADADKRTLIRRVYFDLWGLPPSPQEIEAFVNDPSPDAYPQLIERLLDSPRFGERWGRHWLDIARYAESTGHERNFLYPHAWRYRDYVVKSFNEDKSYDQFLLEQVAGDLLPADSRDQRDEQHVGTGFLAIGPRNLLARNDAFALDTADDQINVTMRAILGLTVSCARCHDHKFDPITTEEYYSLAGIFLSTEPLYGTQPGSGGGNNRHPSELVPIGKDAAEKHQRVVEHDKKVAELTKKFNKADNRFKKLKRQPEAKQAKQAEAIEEAKQARSTLKTRLDKLKENAPEPPEYAMGVRDAQQITDTAVRIGGDSRDEGEIVERGVLACCGVDQPAQMPEDSSGRLQLARWLVSQDHPLTSRVMANRIWYHLLGRGLVETVDNFGVNGRKPSHPELLDYLALQFQQNGWSIKRLIRDIMHSRVYRLSATYDSDNANIDAANQLYWRYQPRRLDAEAIRDSMLAVSGRLQHCPPESGSVVAELGDGCLVRQIDAEQLKVDVNYRSIYLPNARFFEPDSLQIFDGASASLVVGDRAETNVPTQSLYLLNNEFVIEQAHEAASRILEWSTSDQKRIDRAYRLCFGRSPTTQEKKQATKFLERSRQAFAMRSTKDVDQKQIWTGLAQALFASAEFRFVY